MKKKRFGIRAAAVVIMIALLLTGYAATASAAATTQAQKDFITWVAPMAVADMKKNGILASLTIAQAILESGWGTSELALYAKALFGIKADSRWSGPTYSKPTQEYNSIWVMGTFRAYGCWEESINDHSLFLRTGTRYTAVIGERDYKKACRAIHQAGYATGADYADKLIKLIETYGLAAFDSCDTAGTSVPNTPAPSVPTPSNTPATSKPSISKLPVLTAQQKKLVVAILKTLLQR